MEIVGTIKTKMICSDDRSHVYEIVKELDCEGEEVMLLTLYPTLTDPFSLDASTMHMINHMSDMGINRIHFIYLFSKVQNGRMSTRTLSVDDENINYIKRLIMTNPNIKLIVSFGSSMAKCRAAIESKTKLFSIIKEIRPEEPLWQLDADDMEEEAPHILFAGIRYGNDEWGLRRYTVPYKYTAEGYKNYLKERDERRENRIQNMIGRKNKVSSAQEKAENVEPEDVGDDLCNEETGNNNMIEIYENDEATDDSFTILNDSKEKSKGRQRRKRDKQ